MKKVAAFLLMVLGCIIMGAISWAWGSGYGPLITCPCGFVLGILASSVE